MTLEERMRLSFYQPQENLGGHDHIVLTRHVQTGKYYVKKELTEYNPEVYHCLQELKSSFFPEIIEIIEDEGKLILVEEYIKGQTLEEYVQVLGTLSEESVRTIMLQILEAVRILHLHVPPIIHRDIKPSNIVRGQDGIWKLVDFNTARFYDADASRDTTFLGTRSFAAPEQFGDLQTDTRTDIYALGAMMNYLLTGKSHKKVMAEGEMGRIIEKCTRFSPEDRYQSIFQLERAIEALQTRKEPALVQQTRKDPAYVQETRKEPTYVQETHKDPALVQQTREERSDEKALQPEKGPKGISRFLPPGFRTGTIWKMIVACLVYLLLVYTVVTMPIEPMVLPSLAPWMILVERAAYLIMCLLLILFWFDYAGMHAHLPLMKKTSGKRKILGYILYTFVIAFGITTVAVFITGDF